MLGGRDFGQQFFGPFIVGHLPCRQVHQHGPAFTIRCLAGDLQNHREGQTACSLEFNPPFVRPMSRGTSPFLKGCKRYDAL